MCVHLSPSFSMSTSAVLYTHDLRGYYRYPDSPLFSRRWSSQSPFINKSAPISLSRSLFRRFGGWFALILHSELWWRWKLIDWVKWGAKSRARVRIKTRRVYVSASPGFSSAAVLLLLRGTGLTWTLMIIFINSLLMPRRLVCLCIRARELVRSFRISSFFLYSAARRVTYESECSKFLKWIFMKMVY